MIWLTFAAILVVFGSLGRSRDATALVLTSLGFALPALLAWERNEARDRSEAKSRPSWIDFVLVLAALVGLAYYIGKYVDDAYPVIPGQFGGGRPISAQVLFSSEGISGAKALGVAFDDGSGLSEPIGVLFQGSDFYVLCLPTDRNPAVVDSCLPGDQVVQVQADLVKGLIVHTNPRR